ncbi:MAG TPA: FecR domain-containing protein, partial [Terriglobales bacterium]|nr:FecR domain-containing protein [Terriglobales bacterium]
MKRNHNNPKFILNQAIAAVRDDQPDTQAVEAATANAWQRISQEIGIEATVAPLNRIEGCADVQRLLPDFEAHRLSAARSMLVADHLRECAACRVLAKTHKSGGSVLPWRRDSVMRPRHWSFGQYALAASVLIAAVLGIAIGRSDFLAPSGYRAALQSVDGVLYRVDASGEHRAEVGDEFKEGESVRTALGSRAILRLRDGSLVEMNGRSELYVSVGWRNATVNLSRGIVIVQAAKRRSGHLYVKTADARVAVTGTIFSVNSGIKGSRVSVIEGTVQVAQAAGEAVLQAGDQVTTSTSMGEVPVRDEISWSQNRDKYLALLAEFSKLQRNFESIKLPDLRYDSNLLNFVPEGTVVYAGVPNYGEALEQANQLFQQQLSQSEVLREWWQQRGPGRQQNGADFNKVIGIIHGLSSYLGNEIVFTASTVNGPHANVVAMAEIAKSGLRGFLENQMNESQSPDRIHLLSPETLAGTTQGDGRDMYVLITSKFVAASPDVSMLVDVNQRWTSGEPSGFKTGDFGERIASEYSSGTGLLVAVNLGKMASDHAVMMQADRRQGLLEASGFAKAKYIIAQRKDYSGKTSNTAEISFNGPRTGVASWLAAPTTIGALDYITPNAAAVGAFVSKTPAAMVDDLVQICTRGNPDAANSWARVQAELNLDIRNDLAASLGGEAALALDGPLLPVPSWKLIVEVNDPSKLQYS